MRPWRARRSDSALPAKVGSNGHSRSTTVASPGSSGHARNSRDSGCCSTLTQKESSRTSPPTDVNAYLKEITGREVTAKDFRTWAGTVLAALALAELESFDSAAQAKRNLRAAIERVSSRLGNTPTICRKCYIHPEVLNAYLDGGLVLKIKEDVEAELCDDLARLRPEEAVVMAMLRERLDRATGKSRSQHPTKCSASVRSRKQETAHGPSFTRG
jgi:DNA topoisomerase-1